MLRLPRKGILVVCLSAFLVCLAGTAFAQRVLIQDTVDDNQLVPLARNTRPEVKSATDLGAVADNFPMQHMLLQLRRPAEQQQALDRYDEQLSDPQSPNFHKWLTAAEFGQKYGPSEQDRRQVTAWLASRGFQINTVYPNGMTIDFSGTAGQVRAAFHTEIHELIARGERHRANMNDPQIPAALAPAVEGIVALHDFRPHMMHKRHTDFTFPFQGQTAHAIVPADLQTIYNISPLYQQGITGQGQTVVLIEDGDLFTTADWSSFRSRFGLSSFTGASISTIHPAPPSGTNNCSAPGFIGGIAEEAILDAEWASAAAPDAKIVMATCSDTITTDINFGGLIALTNLVNESSQPPAIVSISYGECESNMGEAQNKMFRDTYQQAAAEGVSVFVASGDEGPAECDAGGPFTIDGISASGFASTPFNVAVGGTDFGDTFLGQTAQYWNTTNAANFGSAKSYMPEIPWNDSCASTLLAKFNGFATTFGTNGFCNSSTGAKFQEVVGGSGAPSGCATGVPTDTFQVGGTCKGWAKPSWQSVVGNPNDGVRDLPDVSLFAAAFGTWGHFYILCYSNTGDGGAACGSDPSTWSKAGGTSFSSPVMAGIQALVNQKNGRQGNPNPVYYKLASRDYGSNGSPTCDSNKGPNGSSGCTFHDVTLGDNAMNCSDQFGAINCFDPGGTLGRADPQGTLSLSNTADEIAYPATTGWDFASGLGSVNAFNLVNNWGNVNGPPPADFSLSALPASQSVLQGGSVSYTTSVNVVNGFSGAVSLSVSGLPTGTTGTFTPASITSGSSTLNVSTSSTTPTGTFTLTITGTSSTLTHTVTVTLVITSVTTKPDFSVTATPGSRTVNPGARTTYTVTVSALNGFTGTVGLSVSGLPAGATRTFSHSSITGSGSSTLTITTASTTPTGTSSLRITGKSGTVSHSATVSLVVVSQTTPDFSIAATPASQTVTAGGSTAYTVNVTAVGGFTGAVNLSVSGLPQGATGTFSAGSVTGSGSSQLSVTSMTTTPTGTSPLTITATSGSLTHTSTVSLVVQAASTIPAWQPNTAYKVGDLVTFNGITYKCIQTHTSLVGWEPPNVPALWQPV